LWKDIAVAESVRATSEREQRRERRAQEHEREQSGVAPKSELAKHGERGG